MSRIVYVTPKPGILFRDDHGRHLPASGGPMTDGNKVRRAERDGDVSVANVPPADTPAKSSKKA